MTTAKKNKLIIALMIAMASILLIATIVGTILGTRGGFSNTGKVSYINGEQYYGSLTDVVEDYENEYILAKHAPMGASHYAYTEGVSDEFVNDGPQGEESIFTPGSQLVRVKLEIDETTGDIVPLETVLLESSEGVIRDPSASADGNRVVFSWKKNKMDDDFHLYEINLTTEEVTQLTFGQGVADIEPQYLPNGRIVFNSTRASQKVDCWKTPVSNLYTCDADGKNIIRHGYDQVHTTYPTTTTDGRVIYTRWDYNDRTQMFVQGVFQMFPDGTNQTELYGNGANAPTTLMHTREIPGTATKYVSIVSGHHTWQAGKLVTVDLAEGRNSLDAISFVQDECSLGTNIDTAAQDGRMYSYPYAINSDEMFVSRANSWGRTREGTKFSIVYLNTKTGEEQVVIDGTVGDYSAAQMVPLKPRKLFERPTASNYAVETGTYYIGNIYEGEGLKGVEQGAAKYLRVVALDYRTSAIGSNRNDGEGANNGADPHTPVGVSLSAWDVKQVIGIVPIEEDGSVLFKVPADLPIYFQVLDDKGELIQSMRSWSTLMPNETFSCVGCHENKNSVPPIDAIVTQAMKKGVQNLVKDLWMTGEEYENYNPYKDFKGFSYTDEIQPILDNSCVSCHSNQDAAFDKIGSSGSGSGSVAEGTKLFSFAEDWKYTTTAQSGTTWAGKTFSDSSWNTGKAAFGNSPDGPRNTELSFEKLYMRKTFNVPQAAIGKQLILTWQYDQDPIVYINGVQAAKKSGYITTKQSMKITNNLVAGDNTIAIYVQNFADQGGCYIDASLSYSDGTGGSVDTNPFSLENISVEGRREKMYYSLSYLVLTGSVAKGDYFGGNPTNDYTNWISSMSQVEVLDPYQYGSSKSNIIKLLRENHGEVVLSDEEIYAIAAWIDLAVPFRGSYNEAAKWNSNELREYEENENLRAAYDRSDRLAKRNLAGKEIADIVAIEYSDPFGDIKDEFYTEGSGLVQLFIGQKYKPGGKITVYLPAGYEYIYVSLNHHVKDALVYCPDGIFEYIVPEYANQVMPSSFMRYMDPVVTAYLPTEEEMTEQYNLSLNPYYDGESNVYPRTTSNDNFRNGASDASFIDRNATDGFTTNTGHGTYPVHSWGPHSELKNEQGDASFLLVEFGREVTLDYLVMFIRADFPHDTYFKQITLEFEDGTEQVINLSKTAAGQKITFDTPIVTSTVKFKDFVSETAGGWAAISEIEIFGRNS